MDKSVVDSPDQPSAEITIPDGNSVEQALGRTTHLGIGAHQDDLEFMAMQGIGECFDSIEKWFGGVICTHGGGSVRQGEFAGLSDAELQEVRAKEQREAARMGKYSFVTQLAYGSSEIKDPETNVLEDELLKILEGTHPEVVYTHNLADKHPTHIAVTAAFIKAARRLPAKERPARVIGCEVWRDLDWLADTEKVIMDLSGYMELAEKLRGVFVSQIQGGKRYDLAVAGRNQAHATFFDSHRADDYQSISLGMDLTPLIHNESWCPESYVSARIESFRNGVSAEVAKFFRTQAG